VRPNYEIIGRKMYGKMPQDIDMGKGFLDIIPKVQVTCQNKRNYIKLKKLLPS
jgi:hypothetical protein